MKVHRPRLDGADGSKGQSVEGASFGVKQSDSAYGAERCVLCHGPGKDKDARKVHEVGGSGDD